MSEQKKVEEPTDREAARRDLAYANGYAQAWREWSACADVPSEIDRAFLEQRKTQQAAGLLQAVKVLRNG